VVKILEAASASLKVNGAAIEIQESGMTSLSSAPVARMVGEPELVSASEGPAVFSLAAG
jgi:hypothetical protein